MPIVRLITPIMQAGTNTRRSPKRAATRNAAQPAQLAAAAPVAAFQCIFRVNETASGLSNRPSGPPMTSRAFAVAPVWKCWTAMGRRKVAAEVSSTPAVTARRISRWKVRFLRWRASVEYTSSPIGVPLRTSPSYVREHRCQISGQHVDVLVA